MDAFLSENLILEDDFVLLRALQENDIEQLLLFSINEPNLWKYSLLRANGKENLHNYIDIALKAKESKTEFPFIVFDKITGKYAGSTRFYDINLPFKTLQLLRPNIKSVFSLTLPIPIAEINANDLIEQNPVD